MARIFRKDSSRLSSLTLGLAALGVAAAITTITAGCERAAGFASTEGSGDTPDGASLRPARPGSASYSASDDAFDSGAGNMKPPSFGTTVSLSDSPPPMSGGTLLALSDGRHVVASDPDRDRVYIVDLPTKSVATIALLPHDEPGRLVEDAFGRANVVLRSGGALVTIDVAKASITARRHICAAPRGVDFDAQGARLIVACDSGELFDVSSPPPPGTGERRVPETVTPLARLGEGLRDVVVTHPSDPASLHIFVSRFRTAEIMELDAAGTLLRTRRPPPFSTFDDGGDGGITQPPGFAEATLAWRMIPAPPGSASDAPIVVHQFSIVASVAPAAGGYGAASSGFPDMGDAGSADGTECTATGIVHSAISQGGEVFFAPDQLVLPIDIVAGVDSFDVIAAGNGHTSSLPQLFELTRGPCGAGAVARTLRTSWYDATSAPLQPVAIARAPNGSLLVQSRQPAVLVNVQTGDSIELATDSREDTGHAIFHSNSGTGIACASCHGEGGDDAHVWTFATGEVEAGAPRRTPSLHGTLNGTAPYHWDGSMKDIGMLADQVMTGRMNGPTLSTKQKGALQNWLFAIPSPAAEPSQDPASSARGKALFESPEIGCSACHSGPRFTSSATIDVGTGGAFQVPSLVGVRTRAPFLHDGCAATLADRFGPCGGTMHGQTGALTPVNIADLVNYLQTL